MHERIFVHYNKLPGKINEAVTPCNGGYDVQIDPRQSNDGILRSFHHAMRHIKNMDFEKDNVQEIEYEAHRKE